MELKMWCLGEFLSLKQWGHTKFEKSILTKNMVSGQRIFISLSNTIAILVLSWTWVTVYFKGLENVTNRFSTKFVYKKYVSGSIYLILCFFLPYTMSMTMTEYFKGIGDVTNRSGSVSFARRPIFRSIRAWEHVAHNGGVSKKKNLLYIYMNQVILKPGVAVYFWSEAVYSVYS